MADRATALSLYSQVRPHLQQALLQGYKGCMPDASLFAPAQAKSDLEGRKVKLAKVRGTPGLKEEKISEAEHEVAEAEQRVCTALPAAATFSPEQPRHS